MVSQLHQLLLDLIPGEEGPLLAEWILSEYGDLVIENFLAVGPRAGDRRRAVEGGTMGGPSRRNPCGSFPKLRLAAGADPAGRW
jgi:hypothetical protein